MFVRRIEDRPEFMGGDNTRLREVFNPLKDPVELRYSYAVATVGPGETSRLHAMRTSEVYHLLDGTGVMEIDGEKRDVSAGDVIYIPPHAKQRIHNKGRTDLVFICIVDPAWRPEDEEMHE